MLPIQISRNLKKSALRPLLLKREILFEKPHAMLENKLSKIIVDSAFKIHKTLGSGLLESVYEACLAHELEKRGCQVFRQRAIPVIYEAVQLEIGFRADLVVNDKVLIEVKSIEGISPVHLKQLQTYLRLIDKKLGLLINFNVAG